jgi:hypothetical protein
MTTTIRAHFDGKVIVPDEPVDLPINQPLEISLRPSTEAPEKTPDRPTVEERLKRLQRAMGSIKEGPVIPDEALRRENMYEERW